MIVVTNLFRDQLDRYGEVMHTLEAVREGIRLVPEAVLCLNADDSLTASLAADLPNPVIWFGMEESAVREKLTSSSAAIKALQASGTSFSFSTNSLIVVSIHYCSVNLFYSLI